MSQQNNLTKRDELLISNTRKDETKKCNNKISDLTNILTNFIMQKFGEFANKTKVKVNEIKNELNLTKEEKENKIKEINRLNNIITLITNKNTTLEEETITAIQRKAKIYRR